MGLGADGVGGRPGSLGKNAPKARTHGSPALLPGAWVRAKGEFLHTARQHELTHRNALGSFEVVLQRVHCLHGPARSAVGNRPKALTP
jgi:hypothetical protein